MLYDNTVLEKLKSYGVGHRSFRDALFSNDEPPKRYGVYDEEQEEFCHEIVKSRCHIPGCNYRCNSLLDYENHYNATHRYTCRHCKKLFPSPHFLDLHLQETHDSFFAVIAERKPSYCCLIEECNHKFINTEERHKHCVREHRLPKDFRYDQQREIKTKKIKKNNKKTATPESIEMETDVPGINQTTSESEIMETDIAGARNEQKIKHFKFQNNKRSFYTSYKGKKFTNDKNTKSERHVDIDEAMEEIRESLPT